MRFLAAAIMISVFPMAGFAQDCSRITNDAERLACYDAAASEPASCEIESWKYGAHGNTGSTKVEGATTCASGRLDIRFYNGTNEEFLAAKSTYIEGFVFNTFVDLGGTPSSLNIRYVITQR